MTEKYDTSVFLEHPSPFVPTISPDFAPTVKHFCNVNHVTICGFGVADGLLSQMGGFFSYLDEMLPKLIEWYGTEKRDLKFFKIGFCMPVKEIYAEFLIYKGMDVDRTITMALQKGVIPKEFNVQDFRERVAEFAQYYNMSLILSMGDVIPLFRDYLHNNTQKYPFIDEFYFQLGVEAAELFFKKAIEKV